MKNIYSAFIKAQSDFAPALKTSSNPHFKSRYADLSACVEAVIDALNENGIGLIQRTHDDATGVTVETIFIHESGEQMECGRLHVPAAKNDPQGYGSALTYARRYSLMAACGIAPEDDDGNAASKAKAKKTKSEEAEDAARAKRGGELEELAFYMIDCHLAGEDMKAVAVWYDPKSWSDDNPTEQEERMYAWSLLKDHSKLRSVLKANKPESEPKKPAELSEKDARRAAVQAEEKDYR